MRQGGGKRRAKVEERAKKRKEDSKQRKNKEQKVVLFSLHFFVFKTRGKCPNRHDCQFPAKPQRSICPYFIDPYNEIPYVIC